MHGGAFLQDQKGKTMLARVTRDLERLRAEIAAPEDRRATLIGELGRRR